MISHRHGSFARILLPVSLTAAAMLLWSGCATLGYEKAASTSDAVSAAAAQVAQAQTQITETTNALRDLSSQPARELKPAFERYRAALGDLENTAGELKQQTDTMEKQGREYFDTWDARLSEIRSEDIRARSAQRQREVTDQFTDIQRRYLDARQQLTPLLTNLRDIRAALGVDLTPAGLDSAREFIGRSDGLAEGARQSLDRLAEGLRTLSTQLDPAAAPAPVSTTP